MNKLEGLFDLYSSNGYTEDEKNIKTINIRVQKQIFRYSYEIYGDKKTSISGSSVISKQSLYNSIITFECNPEEQYLIKIKIDNYLNIDNNWGEDSNENNIFFTFYRYNEKNKKIKKKKENISITIKKKPKEEGFNTSLNIAKCNKNEDEEIIQTRREMFKSHNHINPDIKSNIVKYLSNNYPSMENINDEKLDSLQKALSEARGHGKFQFEEESDESENEEPTLKTVNIDSDEEDGAESLLDLRNNIQKINKLNYDGNDETDNPENHDTDNEEDIIHEENIEINDEENIEINDEENIEIIDEANIEINDEENRWKNKEIIENKLETGDNN